MDNKALHFNPRFDTGGSWWVVFGKRLVEMCSEFLFVRNVHIIIFIFLSIFIRYLLVLACTRRTYQLCFWRPHRSTVNSLCFFFVCTWLFIVFVICWVTIYFWRFSGQPDKQLVINSYISNRWGAEERFPNPFEIGKPFQIRILVLEHYFKVIISMLLTNFFLCDNC